MRAALMHHFHEPLSLETVAEPDLPSDGVIVEVKACGLCRSDHHAWVGADPDVALPHVMGHEFAGIVAAVGRDVRLHRVGDRVTAPFILGCGHCPDCQTGQPTICADQAVIGFTQWGAFAERVAIRAADFNLVRLPDSLGYDAAAGMGCRVSTAWRALTDRAHVQPGEWVAIHGCGGVGLAAIMLARALQARVIAIDISPDALTLARDLGAEATLIADHSETTDAIHDMTQGGAHVSIEATGVTAGFANSLACLRKLGRHVQVGMPVSQHATVPLPLLDMVYAKQLSILGMRGLGAPGFRALLEMVEQGHFDPGAMITAHIPLSALSANLAAMGDGTISGVHVVNRFTE